MAATWLITGQNAILVTLSAPVRVSADGGNGADFASPYNANPWDEVIVDTSRGNVVINVPTLVGRGTRVSVKHDDATSLATNGYTVNGPTSPAVQLALPAPNNGTFAASYQVPPAGTPSQNRALYAGDKRTWENCGSSGGYLLG